MMNSSSNSFFLAQMVIVGILTHFHFLVLTYTSTCATHIFFGTQPVLIWKEIVFDSCPESHEIHILLEECAITATHSYTHILLEKCAITTTHLLISQNDGRMDYHEIFHEHLILGYV